MPTNGINFKASDKNFWVESLDLKTKGRGMSWQSHTSQCLIVIMDERRGGLVFEKTNEAHVHLNIKIESKQVRKLPNYSKKVHSILEDTAPWFILDEMI